jgi:hypothetical protein
VSGKEKTHVQLEKNCTWVSCFLRVLAPLFIIPPHEPENIDPGD